MKFIPANYQMQWQALRYAVDQIDLAWSYEQTEYEGKQLVRKRLEMEAYRHTLVKMQEDVLDAKREFETNQK